MNAFKSSILAIASVAAIGASTTALAQTIECTGNDQAGATLVLKKSGQGNLSCADFLRPNGGQMVDAASLGALDGLATGATTTSWSLNGAAQAELTGDVAIVEAADGKTCLYHYVADVFSDGMLEAPGNKNIKTVTVCTDQMLRGTTVDPGSDPGPIATGENCEGYDLQEGANDDFDIVFGVRTVPDGNEQQLAFCSDQRLVQGNPTSVQTQCVNRCETPVVDDSASCTGPFPDGRLPIACRRCATSGAPDLLAPEGPNIDPADNLQYCWEESHALAETDGTEDPRFDDFPYTAQLTFRPVKSMPGGQFSWERVDGSLCYLMSGQTAGGYGYSYYVSLDGGQCPCDPAIDATCLLF